MVLGQSQPPRTAPRAPSSPSTRTPVKPARHAARPRRRQAQARPQGEGPAGLTRALGVWHSKGAASLQTGPYVTTTCTGSLACPSPASSTPVMVNSTVAPTGRFSKVCCVPCVLMTFTGFASGCKGEPAGRAMILR